MTRTGWQRSALPQSERPAGRSSRRPFVRPANRALLRVEALEDRTTPSAAYVPGELLVQFTPDATGAYRADALSAVGATLSRSIHTAAMQHTGQGRLEVVNLPSGVSVSEGIARFRTMSKVVFAEPNYILRTDLVSNDPYYIAGDLWGMYGNDLPAVGPAGTTNAFGSQAEKAWNDGRIGSNAVYIGVIDEGLQWSHPDLAANSWTNPFDPVDGIDNDGNGYVDDVHGWDFRNDDNSTYDGTTDDHGTHVAGTIGGVGGNGEGVAGVSWKVTMISGKFLEDSGSTADAIEAIDYMTDLKQRHGLNLVATNNSWGGGGNSTALHAAINRMAKAGILFITSAGNDSSDNDGSPHYPANYSTLQDAGSESAAAYEAVVSVASLDKDGSLSGFSNYGATSVDLGAAGGDINSTLPEGTYGSKSGTSMATPNVTGAVALYAATYPVVQPPQIRDVLLQSVVPTASLVGKVATGGRLDAYEMLKHSPGPAITFTELSVSPNPIGFGESATLRCSFVDNLDPSGAHQITIVWGDGTADTTFTLAAGKLTFTTQHTYFGTGATVTSVTVTNQKGGTGTGRVTLNMDSRPPQAAITGRPTKPVLEGRKISLGTFITSPNPYAAFSCKWSVVKGGVEVAGSNSPGVSFVPPDQGVYKVYLTVTDNSGNSVAAAPVQITVLNAAPGATGLTNDGGKKPGETVRLTVLKPTDAAADVAAGLRYDFDTDGDGVFDVLDSADPFCDVTFAEAGFYKLKACVRDKDGGVSTDCFTDVLISEAGGGNGLVVTKRYVAAGSEANAQGRTSWLRVFNADGTARFALRPFGNSPGGVRVATGDVNGDKVEDVIAAPGPKGGSSVKVFDGVSGNALFTIPDVYGADFAKGVFVAAGDFNCDGYADIAVAAGPGAAVPVVGYSGFDGAELFRFNPFGARYKGGVSVAAGHVDGDGHADVVVGQMTGGSQVKVFLYTAAGLEPGPARTLSAMPKGFKGGVFVAAGDVDGDGRADLIVGSNNAPGQDSRVRVISGADFALRRDFIPFPGYRGGVRVAAEDLDGDGRADIVAAPAKPAASLGANPRVIGLSGRTLAGLLSQELTDYAFQGGVYVG